MRGVAWQEHEISNLGSTKTRILPSALFGLGTYSQVFGCLLIEKGG